MAGGRSQRMRSGGCKTHKALREIGGRSLIERNLDTLCCSGLRHVWVAVSTDEHELRFWVDTTGKAIASRSGARLEVLVEALPLGTIGSARCLADIAENIVVVNVDNLTGLDLTKFVAFHIGMNAALSIATHDELFRIPFGRVNTVGERVTEYHEKPNIPVTISSGTYVLHRRAMLMIPESARTDIPVLVQTLLEANEIVASYRHDAWWVDVNDELALARAEAVLELQQSLSSVRRQPLAG
ncbi:MAG: NTP transferase domain-containing protein [Acidobacteriaceae bacterium]|nr:NTP transferase domain-containing protein [Acidobacteriaceae bacterium]